jgi:hypothetical protein
VLCSLWTDESLGKGKKVNDIKIGSEAAHCASRAESTDDRVATAVPKYPVVVMWWDESGRDLTEGRVSDAVRCPIGNVNKW